MYQWKNFPSYNEEINEEKLAELLAELPTEFFAIILYHNPGNKMREAKPKIVDLYFDEADVLCYRLTGMCVEDEVEILKWCEFPSLPEEYKNA